jgi:hypothetical protein
MEPTYKDTSYTHDITAIIIIRALRKLQDQVIIEAKLII